MNCQVMLVDDSEADRLYTRIMLERSGVACEVIEFEAARDALAYLGQQRGHPVSIILLDINMPGMDGFEFLQAYEALPLPLRAKTVVVMLTTSPDPQDKARAESFASVRGYVTKPLTLQAAARLLQPAGPL